MTSFLNMLSDDNPENNEDLDYDNLSVDLKNEISMLVLSRPMYVNMEGIPVVRETVINYGINRSLTGVSDKSEQIVEMKKRIILALNRFEPRFQNVIVEHVSFDTMYEIFRVSCISSAGEITFRIHWSTCDGNIVFNE